MRKSKIARFFNKYINGTKGVISLFLAILMVPFATIAGVLINAGRINSAVAIFDEALCNASNSTLGTYDEFLRSRFSLMAMSQNTSGGGTQFGNTSSQYTADDFINDLFVYYMEQNVGCLSSTYTTTNVGAEGLYPLGDPAVLKSSVLQASKITVPVKMVADWGSVDDMLKQLTEPLDLLASVENTLSSGMTVASDIDKLIEKKDALEEQIQKCNDARTAYNTAYEEFKTAATSFNSLVDNINYWAGQVSTYQAQLDELDKKVVDINNQIAAKTQKLKELKEDTKNDHAEEIKTLEEEIETLKEDREEKAPGYNQTVENLSNANSTLNSYKNQFSGKRTTAVDKKNAYYEKIVALRNEIDATSTSVVGFQDSITSLINDGAGLIADATSTGLAIAQNSVDKQKTHLSEEDEYYRYQKTLAEGEGYTEEATYYYNLLQENESTKQNLDQTKSKYGNADKLTSESISTMKDVNSDLTDFSNRDLVSEYRTIYQALDDLRIKVSNRTIPQTYTKVTYSDCYYTVVNPVEKGNIGLIIEGIENQIVENGGWAVLKAIVGFLDALLTIKATYDPELNVTIDTSLYSGNGGLPSKIDRDAHPLTSSHAAEDAALSEEYKKMLNSYSDVKVYPLEGEGESTSDKIEQCINDLKGYINDFKLSNLSKMLKTAGDLIANLVSFGSEMLNSGLQAMGDKFLLVGYVSYNTANRTTYSGKALSGASFGLPSSETSGGYCFAGAETEYIFKGSMNETTNQKSVFTWMWIERMIFDIAPVLGDATIQTIASTISAFTFGIGGPIVYVICIVAEAFVDAIILVNGGEIPMLKSFAYITPTGIPKLLKQLVSLQLPKATQKAIYEKASDCAFNMNKGIQDKALEHGKYIGDDPVELPSYDDYVADQSEIDKQQSFTNIFTLNYTKSLQILMFLLTSTNKLVTRLADIIQMEASYKAAQGVATYGFNLDKSYTYLRASGSFTSNVFIQIGENDTLNSEHRVIYNGY